MDFFIQLIESNINYSSLLSMILLYIVILWGMVSLWTGVDANRRYGSLPIGVGFFLMVLIMNIPALIFYLIIKPDADDENVLYLDSSENYSSAGGVQIPVVNFTGNDGISITLQLNLSKNVNTIEKGDVNINVSVDNENKAVFIDNSQKTKSPENSVKNVQELPENKNISKSISMLTQKVKHKSNKFLAKVKKYAQELETSESYDDKKVTEKK